MSYTSEIKQKNAYFAAANGYTGFRSYYATVYPSEDYRHIFVLKGGPGTGKSRLMKEVGNAAEENGYAVTYYYCSSDPASLDGVVITGTHGKIAVLDGTAPHARCADIPGVIDEIINLGAFWSSDELMESREEILYLMKEKSDAFARGYTYLAIAGKADTAARKLLRTAVNGEKLEGAIRRMLRPLTTDKSIEETRITDAVSMRGICHFETLEAEAENICYIGNRYGFAALYFEKMRKYAKENGYRTIRIESPFSQEITDGIYFPCDRILFLNADTSHMDKNDFKYVNPMRFIDKKYFSKIKGDLRVLLSEKASMEEHAIAAFKNAGEYHFALEEKFIAAMDFPEKETCQNNLKERILSLLRG